MTINSDFSIGDVVFTVNFALDEVEPFLITGISQYVLSCQSLVWKSSDRIVWRFLKSSVTKESVY